MTKRRRIKSESVIPQASTYVRLGNPVHVEQGYARLGNPVHVEHNASISQDQKPKFNHSYLSQTEWELAKKLAEQSIKKNNLKPGAVFKISKKSNDGLNHTFLYVSGTLLALSSAKEYQILGRGEFGKVKVAITENKGNRPGNTYAVKVQKMEKSDLTDINEKLK